MIQTFLRYVLHGHERSNIVQIKRYVHLHPAEHSREWCSCQNRQDGLSKIKRHKKHFVDILWNDPTSFHIRMTENILKKTLRNTTGSVFICRGKQIVT